MVESVAEAFPLPSSKVFISTRPLSPPEAFISGPGAEMKQQDPPPTQHEDKPSGVSGVRTAVRKAPVFN